MKSHAHTPSINTFCRGLCCARAHSMIYSLACTLLLSLSHSLTSYLTPSLIPSRTAFLTPPSLITSLTGSVARNDTQHICSLLNPRFPLLLNRLTPLPLTSLHLLTYTLHAPSHLISLTHPVRSTTPQLTPSLRTTPMAGPTSQSRHMLTPWVPLSSRPLYTQGCGCRGGGHGHTRTAERHAAGEGWRGCW